jgi:hypothetical protein
MATKKPQKTKDGKKVYGPYKPASKGGRPVYSVVNSDGSRSSTHAARFDYEKKTGKKLDKNTDVDHKDNNKKNGSSSNLRAMSHSKNVAKENKHRVGKKENQK